MKNILILTILFLAACTQNDKINYYPDYAVSVEVKASNQTFMFNGQRTPSNSIKYLFTAKETGDNTMLLLQSDTLSGFDTTAYRVNYSVNGNVVQSDTGYSIKGKAFTPNWIVK